MPMQRDHARLYALTGTAAALVGALAMHGAQHNLQHASVSNQPVSLVIGSPSSNGGATTLTLEHGKMRMSCDRVFNLHLATIGYWCRPANARTATNTTAIDATTGN